MVGGVSAQSNLPQCQGTDTSAWSNCFGTATYDDGDKYVGEFKGGKYNGQGTYFCLANNQFKGHKYVGKFKDGSFNGQGTYTFKGGDKYVGEFKDNKYNGQGTFTFIGGDKYVGEYKDNKYDGQGVYTFANGRVELGEWKNHEPHGRFIEYRVDKSIARAGIFEEGKFIRAENINRDIFTRISQGKTVQQTAQKTPQSRTTTGYRQMWGLD